MGSIWQQTSRNRLRAEPTAVAHEDSFDDPLRDVDLDAVNARVSQLRAVERTHGDDAAVSVAFGEAVVVVETSDAFSEDAAS